MKTIIEQQELDANQIVVLEWLQDRICNDRTLTSVLWELMDDALSKDRETTASKAWNILTTNKKAELLIIFNQWIIAEQTK